MKKIVLSAILLIGLSSFKSHHQKRINVSGGKWYVSYPSPNEMDCDRGGNDVCDISGFLKKNSKFIRYYNSAKITDIKI